MNVESLYRTLTEPRSPEIEVQTCQVSEPNRIWWLIWLEIGVSKITFEA